MEPHLSTTPFGRRSLTLAHIAAQAKAKAREPDKVVHKWNLFRAICVAKERLGVSERALAVLDALLTFHPENALTGDGLIVFPSNSQLALRAHGMAPATLRRHLAALVDAGIIIRRDSPNGKRYARKGQGGQIETAFGFDLTPLVARADELEALAEEVRVEERALKVAKERVTLCRRDIAKMIATALEEGVAIAEAGQGRVTGPTGPSDWAQVHSIFRGIVGRIPRQATRAQLEPIAEELSLLADEILSLLETHINSTNSSANESQNERHKQSSNPDSLIALEPVFQKRKGAEMETDVATGSQPPLPSGPNLVRPIDAQVKAGKRTRPLERLGHGAAASQAYPLGMVLDACPDIVDYAKGGIGNWRDLLSVAAVVRSMLGVSPSAWAAAQEVMGEIPAAIVVAAILQKGAAVTSAGGYLRSLTQKAEAGEFSVGPMLMALIGSRKREKKQA
jgi:replication initiation protein RepC